MLRFGNGESRWASMNRGGVRCSSSCPQHRVEALDVPDLQHEASRLRQVDQRLRALRIVRDRFLDQDVLPRLEQGTPDRQMGDGRGGDGRRIDHRYQLLQRRRSRRSIFFRHLLRTLGALVKDRAKLGVRELGHDARVVRPDRAEADDTSSDFLHATP